MNRQTIRELASILGVPVDKVERYAKDTASGWVKRMLDSLFGRGRTKLSGRGTPTESEVVEALRGLARGTKITAGKAGGLSAPPAAPPRAPRGPITAPPPPPQPGPITTTFGTAQEPPKPGEVSGFGQEILVTNSSNVFSFSYNPHSSTLYVTYLASSLNADAVTVGRRRQGRSTSRSQLLGKRGQTVTGKTNARGPMYAYFDVPARVFEQMKLASSKGKFVWDKLRVRGTIYGHKYRYSLVQGSVTIQRGVSGVYIPRKATPQGFRSRSVADLGRGRREFQTSTLPAQEGFRTRTAPRRGTG